MTVAAPIKLLIVDDHDIVREGISSILSQEPDFDVVGEASDGPTAIAAVERLHPSVVLLDMRMPGPDGIEVCREITTRFPNVRVIILTAFLDSDTINRCIQAGAKGYVIKDVERTDLKRSIRDVAQGEAFLDRKVHAVVVERLKRETERNRPVLTEREVSILKFMAEGFTNRQIATKLYVSEGTIKDQLQKIIDKLGATNRVSALYVAAKEGMI
ncbi:MAG: two-component response regulator [Chloroflexi bacterium]|jgi:two-component system response regulator DevR|nr:two-component response regulator [Chloroflexota bacterium]